MRACLRSSSCIFFTSPIIRVSSALSAQEGGLLLAEGRLLLF